MDKKKVSTSNFNLECESDAVAPQGAAPEEAHADDSNASSGSSVDNVESLARRLQKFSDESKKKFQKLFLQIRVVADNLTNAIRDASIEIERRARGMRAEEEATNN